MEEEGRKKVKEGEYWKEGKLGWREGNREIKLFSGVIMNRAGSVAYIGFKSCSHGSRYRIGESSGYVGPWQREAGVLLNTGAGTLSWVPARFWRCEAEGPPAGRSQICLAR